jgi:MFS family permease
LVTYSEIAINVGIVLGFASGLVLAPLTTDQGQEWRLMFACGAIMPVIMILLVGTGVMPESPRWLLQKGRRDEAQQVLAQVYECTTPDDPVVQEIVREIQASIRREEMTQQNAVGVWSMISQPSIRRTLLIGVGTAVSQQAVGIDAIQYYLLDVIGQGGWESETTESVILILLGLLKLVFILVGGALFDRRGRRPLFFVSVLGMAAALLMMSLAFLIDSTLSKRAVIVCLAIYLSFFSIGMGPGAWLIPSEVFPLSIRGKAMSLATFGNRVTATLMSSTFLSTAAALGMSGLFFLLFIVCLMVLVFLYLYLPETKDKTLEEMTVYFAHLTGDTSVLEAEARVQSHYHDNGGVEIMDQHDAMAGGDGGSSYDRIPPAPNPDTEREII